MTKEENNNNNVNVFASPEIIGRIEKLSFNIILDTGAQISCISSSFFKQLQEQVKEKISILPSHIVTLKLANNKTIKSINKQCLLAVNLNDSIFYFNCIVVPKLFCSCLIGTDQMYRYKTKIDFSNRTVTMVNSNATTVIFFHNCLENAEKMLEIVPDTNLPLNYVELAVNVSSDFNYEPFSTINLPTPSINILNNNNSDRLTYLIKNKVDECTLLNSKQKTELLELLNRYKNIFSEDPGKCNKYQYRLELNDSTPIVKRSYPIPYNLIQQVDQQISKMLKLGIIEEAKTEYISPNVIVKKKNGTIRFCTDGRFLNEKLKSDPLTMDSVEVMLQKCYDCKFLSTLDLNSAYWQVELEPECRRFTGFQYKTKTYQYCRVPFGLKVSLAAMIRALNVVFNDEIQNFTILFVDDILTFSKTFDEHIKYLDIIFNKLSDAGMTLNLEKSKLLTSEVEFLGFKLSNEGLTKTDTKVKAIKDFPSPKNAKQLKSFFGLCGFYQRFVQHYSDYISPLLPLTSKKLKWSWLPKHEEQFRLIKEKFLDYVMLSHPDTSKDYHLSTDASGVAISGILYQYNDSNEMKVIAFLSRVLKTHELNYTIYELELLAVIWSLKKCRNYIIGSKIHIHVDNLALTHINSCKLLNNRLMKWSLMIQEYDFTIEHCKSKDNVAADVLSRHPSCSNVSNPVADKNFRIATYKFVLDKDTINFCKNITKFQQEDPVLKLIIEEIKSTKGSLQLTKDILQVLNQSDVNTSPNCNKNSSNDSISNNKLNNELPKYILIQDILYFKTYDSYKIYLPQSLIKTLVWQTHNYLAHQGAEKVYNHISDTFYWRGMRSSIRKILSKCIDCQMCKHLNRTYHAQLHNIIPEDKHDLISIDFIGPLPSTKFGYTFILVVVNCFTKYLCTYPLRKATTIATLNKLTKHYFPTFGLCRRCLSDHGSQFTSHLWAKKMKELNIKHVLASVYHPSANPVERFNRNLVTLLRTYVHNKHSSWYEYLSFITEALNKTINNSTNYTPEYLQFGRKPTHFWDKYVTKNFQDSNNNKEENYRVDLELAKKNMIKKGLDNKLRVDNKHKTFTYFTIGDKVLLRANNTSIKIDKCIEKFFKIYLGPFLVTKAFNDCTYELTSMENIVRGNFHISLLKKFIE